MFKFKFKPKPKPNQPKANPTQTKSNQTLSKNQLNLSKSFSCNGFALLCLPITSTRFNKRHITGNTVDNEGIFT